MELKKLLEMLSIKSEYEKIKRDYKSSQIFKEVVFLKDAKEKLELEIKKLEEEKRKLSKIVRENSFEEKTLQEKEEKILKKMYTEKSSSPKELLGLQERLEKVKNKKDIADEKYLESSISLDEIEEKIKVLKNDLENKEMEYTLKLIELNNFKEECQEKLDTLSKKFKSIKENLDSKTLEKFKSLFQKYGETAISKLIGNKCSGCNLEVSVVMCAEIRRGDRIVRCENCGRILYNVK